MQRGNTTIPNAPSAVTPPLGSSSPCFFLEFFAGFGNLSRAVEKVGIPVAPPNDVLSGGVDLSNELEVQQLQEHLPLIISLLKFLLNRHLNKFEPQLDQHIYLAYKELTKVEIFQEKFP